MRTTNPSPRPRINAGTLKGATSPLARPRSLVLALMFGALSVHSAYGGATPRGGAGYQDLYLDVIEADKRDVGGDKIVDVNFGVGQEYVPVPAKSERCTGSLPKGVLEDSAWAKVWVDYQQMIDDMGGGLSWLRAEIKKHESGAGQLKFILPPLDRPLGYRLAITAASPTNSVMSVRMMQNGPPYRTYWERRFGLVRDRETIVSDFNLDAISDSVALIISFGQSGTFDLFDISLETRSEQEIKDEMNRRYPDGGPRNIISNSHFPLGLQSGWTAGVNFSTELDIDFLPSPEEADPERGTVPMRFRTKSRRGNIRLFSAPFEVPLAYQPHCLSFYVKGECKGEIKILCDGQELATKDIDISSPDAFVRVELPFTPVLQGKFHTFTFRAKGDFLLDAVMANPGEKAEPFTFHRGAEISLSHRFESKNTMFLDEGAAVEIKGEIRGAWPNGAKIAIRKYNAYGEVGGAPDVKLPAADGKPFSFAVSTAPANPRRPLGSQRIEASLVDAEGKVLGPVQELVYHILNRPRYWGETAPEESPFGLHFNVYEPYVVAAKALGINWVRTHGPNGFITYWSSFEPRQGEFVYHDDYVEIFRQGHIRILGVLTECPGWARITRPTGGAWLDHWWQPRDFAEFGNYAQKIAAHYKGRIDHWEIWNEPWGGFWFKEWDASKQGRERWSRGDDPLGDFMRLSEIAYNETLKGNPDAYILGINATAWGGGRGEDWMRDMIAAGGMEFCDAVAFHTYHNDNLVFFGSALDRDSRWAQNFVRNVIEPYQAHPDSKTKPLWMTEGKSSEATRNSSLYRHTVLLHTDDLGIIQSHAALLPAYHAALFAEGVEKIFLYTFEALGFRPLSGIDWSVMVTKSGELSVNAAAYSAMTSLLEGAEFAERTALGDGWHQFVFKAPAAEGTPSRTVVMLAGENPGEIPFPEIANIRRLDIFGNPVAPGEKPFGQIGYLVGAGGEF